MALQSSRTLLPTTAVAPQPQAMVGPNRRIGLLGGTFNPVHLGHLIAAQHAFEAFDLTRVLMIPCAMPPHKSAVSLLSGRHRQRMLELAVADDPRFAVNDIELRRGGTSYAVDTVRELAWSEPGADLFFIIGSDTLRELHMWRDIYTLLRLCTFVTIGRPGAALDAMGPGELKLDPPWPDRLLQNAVCGRQVDISSSDIRHRAAEGLSIRYLVPGPVERYVLEHRLYTGGVVD